MALARHTKANREFFEPGCAPTIHEWTDWVNRGVVKGKVIDGRPYIDLNWFAANDSMEAIPQQSGQASKPTGLDLLL